MAIDEADVVLMLDGKAVFINTTMNWLSILKIKTKRLSLL